MSDLSFLRNHVPSVFATQPYETLSDKYTFIPTIDVVESLADQGFTVHKAFENRVRTPGKVGFAKHLLRFRNSDVLPAVGDYVPEIVLTNSHDGSSAFRISAGLYRLVCSNGLTVGGDTFSTSRRHSGDVGHVIDGVYSIIDDFPEIVRTQKVWGQIDLTPRQQLAFAEAAVPLRWDVGANGNSPVNPSHLLRTHRWADDRNDLWTTFNRVQENLIKGGVRAVGSTGRRIASKAVKSVDGDQRLNKSLWTLAQALAEAA